MAGNKNAAAIAEQVLNQNTGKEDVVYRSFPVFWFLSI
jgi:hypothetical protein